MFLAADVGGYDSGGRGPYDDFWYGPVPGKTTSGVRVNDETAMRLAVVFGCVNVISSDIAKVPLVMYRRHDDGSRERVTDHPAIKLLQRPTRQFTGLEWKQRMQAHQLLRGNAYNHIRTDWRGRAVGLDPWKPDNVRVEVMADKSLRYHVRDPLAGTEATYVEGEVLHLRGLSLDGPLGLSPIDQMKETLGEGVSAQAYGSSFFANDARPSIWLKHPSHFKDESQRKDWLAAFKKSFGGANRFSPMLTEYGIEISSLPAVSHADLQFLELRKFKSTEICAIFRVPPHKVAILERSTNNNIEHQGIEYVTDCLLTWCRRWEERLAEDLLTESERDEFYFEFLLDALMRGDAKSRNEAYMSGIQAGWLTRNEVRKRENLDVLDDLDEPLQPVNMAPAGSMPAGATPEPPDADEKPEPADKGAPEDDAQEARSRNLELQARRRVLNRETKALSRELERSTGNTPAFAEAVATFYASHVHFVAESLVLTWSHAEAYVMAQADAVGRAIECGNVRDLLSAWESSAKLLMFDPLPVAAPVAKPPAVTVHVPQAAAPAVTVNIPEAAAPAVNVSVAPAPVTVVQPARRSVERTVVAQDENGMPIRTIEREIDEGNAP